MKYTEWFNSVVPFLLSMELSSLRRWKASAAEVPALPRLEKSKQPYMCVHSIRGTSWWALYTICIFGHWVDEGLEQVFVANLILRSALQVYKVMHTLVGCAISSCGIHCVIRENLWGRNASAYHFDSTGLSCDVGHIVDNVFTYLISSPEFYSSEKSVAEAANLHSTLHHLTKRLFHW